MGRLLCAGLLLAALAASSRAEEDAYVALVGMALSASTDRGPEAGDLPKDSAKGGAAREAAPDEGSSTAEPLKDAVKSPEEPAPAAPAPASAAVMKTEEKRAAAPAVAVPADRAPRVWTRFFASLSPSMPTLEPKFEAPASTSAARVPLRPRPAPRQAPSAAKFGAAMGLTELVATSAAVSLPDR